MLRGGNKPLDMEGSGKVNVQRTPSIRTPTGKDRAGGDLEKQTQSGLASRSEAAIL